MNRSTGPMDRKPRPAAAGYTRNERRALATAVRAGERPSCPRCGTPLESRTVDPGPAVSYVRHRVLLICPDCRRTAAVDH